VATEVAVTVDVAGFSVVCEPIVLVTVVVA